MASDVNPVRSGRFSPPVRRWCADRSETAVRQVCGFTLIELLVVISIMALIASLAVPALKNLGRSNIRTSANRQMLDDLGRARQLAIGQHTTVYMVFVPTNFFNLNNVNGQNLVSGVGGLPSPDQQTAMTTLSNLVNLQLTGYNFLSFGQVGDQPGQHSWQYLSTWQSLPDGNFIAPGKFESAGVRTTSLGTALQNTTWQQDYAGKIDNWYYAQPQIYGFITVQIPFPTEQSPLVWMPCLVWDSTGRLISETSDNISFHHAYIPLVQGSVGVGRDVNKAPTLTTVAPNAISEVPPGNSTSISYNIIDVDPFSGRARLLLHRMP